MTETPLLEILSQVLAFVALVAGLVAVVRFARHDSFAGPGTTSRQRDELGSPTFRRRAA